MKNRGVRGFSVCRPVDSPSASAPENRKPGKGGSIVLRADTFLELGSPADGSCEMMLYTDCPELLQDGRVVLIGPDVGETAAACLPFARVILFGGERVTESDYARLRQSLNVSGQIEGYMEKSSPENIWCRISRQAFQNGLRFETLGSVLIHRIRSELPTIQAAEVLFVTSGWEDVVELDRVARPAREAARGISERIWKSRGIDLRGCVLGGECGLCKDKAACDSIRMIAAEL